MKQLFYKWGTCLASMALMVTVMNINTTCMMYVHQPKLPSSAKKLRKF